MSHTVTVVIPIYNVEKYLEQCLDSVINQTYKDIEIICINDGSTDNSITNLEKYALSDNRIKIISQTNQGISAARNAGIKVATGKYITFLDSDDFLCRCAGCSVLYLAIQSKSSRSERQLSGNQKHRQIPNHYDDLFFPRTDIHDEFPWRLADDSTWYRYGA